MTDMPDLIALSSPTEERNPATTDLDTLPSAELTWRILGADAQVITAVQALAVPLAALVDACVAAIVAGGTVHYVGAGTSGRLAVLDAAELAPTFNAGPELFRAHLAGGPEAMLHAVEGAEDSSDLGAALIAEHCGPDDLVIGLAASGRTPFVGGALAAARERGLVTGLISANPQASLATLADHALLADVGPEVVTGSTRMKAGTAQKLLLNALSTATMVRLGKTYSNLMIDVRPSNEKLVARTVRMLVQASGVDAAEAGRVLEEAGGSVRVALIALLAGSDAAAAREAADRFAPDAARIGDPAGIRAAVASLGTAG
ncbi:N-acetylmuramic acid 6-phosphate etherase [Brachybacterium hainanense]|uniref:N-acetylmuramic acid 6-phosphate etherase n=1 Tax=Brachybacterium hainanense TaxID=1541174 RepID=A0ABV6REY4_9MICO